MPKFDYDFLRKGGFDTRKMADGTIYFYEKKQRSKSELAPLAQSTTLCAVGVDWSAVSTQLLGVVSACRYSHVMFYELATIMYYSGCRVSEVLRIKRSDLISSNQIFLHASKNSEDRIVTIPNLNLSHYLLLTDPGQILFELSRFHVYRYSITIGLNLLCNGLFESKPTKLFRYCYASLLYSKTKNLSLVAHTLGHKNVENSKYYIYELRQSITKHGFKK
jgi:integrase